MSDSIHCFHFTLKKKKAFYGGKNWWYVLRSLTDKKGAKDPELALFVCSCWYFG